MGNKQSENSKVEDETAPNETNKATETNVKDDTIDEKKESKVPSKQSLDIAFVLDCTGSMNSYIQSCKDNINTIAQTINKETDNKYDTQFGLILYRDIPPEDTSFITKRIDFTPIPLQIQLKLNTISADGGGDHPEALTSALYDCHNNLKWRPNSVKVIVVITDAPPHGIETAFNDGFPNGDIDTFNDDQKVQKEGIDDADDKKQEKYLNVIDIIKNIRNELNASIYSVACEPSLSCDADFAIDFMQYMAEYTNGKFLPLSSATLLPSVIIGSVQQQINLDILANKLEDEIISIKKEYGDDISNDKLNELIAEKWKNEGIERKQIEVSDVYKVKRSRENVDLLLNQQVIKSLADFKNKCKKIPRMKITDYSCLDIDGLNEVNSVEYRSEKKKKGNIFNGFKSLWRNSATELRDAEDELDQQHPADNELDGCDLDVGDVVFNPMATGVPGMNRPADAFGNELHQRQLDQQNEIVDVSAEIFQVRQDYGQVVGMRGGMSSSIVGNIRAYGNRKGGY